MHRICTYIFPPPKKSHRRASSSDCYKIHQIISSYAYMDGSCINTKTQFALVIPDRLTSNIAKKNCGTINESMAYVGELQGILDALSYSL